MTGYRLQKPRIGLTKCPDLVDHYTLLMALASNDKAWSELLPDFVSTFLLMRHTYRFLNIPSVTFIKRWFYEQGA